ncbi:Mannonate dehydratase [Rubellimicrobium mesophilum DSM 19309]|uniref:Mannonate dehydratase n=1 Tax=Rubellimicrobium mesophilum DSM 19309 TaxID=442562 RepID=A0A017HP28_9RHOB|nr:mannonate dehydratase [Rubellimicrobium mesophilum]EYD76267.1 Mannonate dehydratase [Rubellimicrobium mesophilum DSM 19309]
MEQCWRWFGPRDPIPLAHVRQAGATGIVTAIHEHYRGEVWPEDAIAERKRVIEEAGLRWSVVESIPVPNAIKLGGEPAREATAAFAETMRRLARAGLRTICYNFMPVVDWTRTELRHPMPSGGLALRFDMTDFVAYDAFILDRPDAGRDYTPDLLAKAEARAKELTPEQVQRLESTIIAGLPGAEDSHSRAGIAAIIARYRDTAPDDLRAHLRAFHETVVPIAREEGLNLCIHPDDPPFPLFGLPRVVSTAQDLESIFAAVPERENGLTFCAGSLGARADNDLPAILSAHADRVHFVHLRNVSTDPDGSFVEDDHLVGNADMVTLLAILLKEEARRRDEGRTAATIPFRPDHGHLLLDDQEKRTNPGYSAIGRLKGLAELRGILTALAHPTYGALA